MLEEADDFPEYLIQAGRNMWTNFSNHQALAKKPWLQLCITSLKNGSILSCFSFSNEQDKTVDWSCADDISARWGSWWENGQSCAAARKHPWEEVPWSLTPGQELGDMQTVPLGRAALWETGMRGAAKHLQLVYQVMQQETDPGTVLGKSVRHTPICGGECILEPNLWVSHSVHKNLAAQMDG